MCFGGGGGSPAPVAPSPGRVSPTKVEPDESQRGTFTGVSPKANTTGRSGGQYLSALSTEPTTSKTLLGS